METRTIKAQKTTVTVKRANGSVETLDITAKVGSCSKTGFEARILPMIIAANKKVGTEVISWSHEDAQTEMILTDADRKAIAEEKEYIDSRKKIEAVMNM
ncbi:hypothetical protein EOM81_11475 [bacterium]|nr:hypothetical protein [bacterium]